jgi:HlyD family secretion protein
MKWPTILGLSLLALVAVGGAWSRLSSTVAVDVARVTAGPIRASIEERGKTRLAKTYLVTMPYEGRIEAIDLAEGDTVEQGQIVARIVTDDLKLKLDRATATVERFDAALAENDDTRIEQVALKQAHSFAESVGETVKAAAARVTAGWEKFQYQTRHRTRVEGLIASGAQSEDDLDQARLAEVESKTEYLQDNLVQSAMTALQVATNLLPSLVEKQIERKQLRHAVLAKERAGYELARQQAQLDLQRGTMRSPVTGMILARHASNERLLAAGTVLLEIGRLEDLQIEADLLSQEVADVHPAAAVEIFGPAIGEPVAQGQVATIYPAGFTKISSLGVEQQRVRVIIQLSRDDLTRLRTQRRLGVGYRVQVRIATGQSTGALQVPRSALFRGADGQWQLFAVEGGLARLKTVAVGLINDARAEVTDGLAEGDLVVAAAPTELSDGARIRAAAP